jgi:cation:H+ antiporter
MAAEVAGFPADLEHVDEHEFRAMSACRALEFFQASQDLAGEGAAEVTKKDEDKQPGVGGRSQAFPGGELEYRRGVRQRGIVVQGAGWPAHGPARAAAFMIASEHRANPRRHPQRRKERLPGRGVNRAIFFLEKTADSPDVPTPMTLSTIVFLLLGLVLLVGGAEYLVRGAASLAAAAGVSSLVVGLTVVAFGTSSPELAVSVVSAYKGQADLALGNVVGSNIFNVLFILGLSAVIIPLVVAQQLVRLDVPLMIGASVLMFLLALDGIIGRVDGVFLFAGVLAYTVFLIRQSRRESSADVKAEYENEFGNAKQSRGWLKNIGLVLIGLAGLMLGSKWLVDSSVTIARSFGVSELIIGLTIVAAGTSMPEVATSVVAALRGERDIAVGNVVGSNIFNILCVIGLSSIVAPAGISVSPAALRFDMPVMIGVAVACLPVFFSGYRISRVNGAVFLGFYAAYLTYLVFTATRHEALGTYRAALLYYVLPLSAITLIFITWRGLRVKPA